MSSLEKFYLQGFCKELSQQLVYLLRGEGGHPLIGIYLRESGYSGEVSCLKLLMANAELL